MAKPSIDIAESLARLSAATIFELRGEWRRLHRAPPPMRLSRDLLLRGGAVCTDAASALLRSRAWMTLNIVGTRNSVAQVAKSRPPITAFTREPRAGALHHSPRQRNGAPLSDRYARA
jgi:hypothetical protein